MNLQIAIRFFKLKLHFPTKVSKNQKAWWTNFRYIMGLYSFGSKLFLYVKYLKNRIWSAKSSPVTGSTLHTAHCTLHTVQYTLHLYLHLHLPCLWTIKNTHWTLHTTHYMFILHVYHLSIHRHNGEKSLSLDSRWWWQNEHWYTNRTTYHLTHVTHGMLSCW